jgi:hypothetical protein
METVEVCRRAPSYSFSSRRAERWGMSKSTSEGKLQ